MFSRQLQSYLFDVTGLVVMIIVFYFISASQSIGKIFSINMPSSFLQLNTIFLSILIEAIPFILISVLIAGFIQIFITEDHIKRWIPKNRFAAIFVSCVVGAIFPACECGIVPIVRRLISKGVPTYAGVGFLLTGPLINPIVIFSTYVALGSKMAGLRMGIGFIAALAIAFIISLLFKSNQLQHNGAGFSNTAVNTGKQHQSLFSKLEDMLKHAIDEFFDMGKYLIIGAFVAALVQTYVTTTSLFILGDSVAGSSIIMMALAYVLSLCSEADAFIGASFKNLVPSTSILAFLVYGPMIDLKNTIMLWGAFKTKFVLTLFILITLIVFLLINLITLL
ncbi:permease [Oceanobacillus neutriphilus]|uniref:Permease n=1 Tax=Oceanobacillus neutriphilus TaxID=531815 RepID=A0ABQ2NPP8_9BACI|nr:permease [Oceanobacillus neutriphilus]GGP08669.1 hypothetical protein GCM10011346_09630 [Oceanobacillus neutriphilus]